MSRPPPDHLSADWPASAKPGGSRASRRRSGLAKASCIAAWLMTCSTSAMASIPRATMRSTGVWRENGEGRDPPLSRGDADRGRLPSFPSGQSNQLQGKTGTSQRSMRTIQAYRRSLAKAPAQSKNDAFVALRKVN
jgi:hypothetical protein